MAKNSSSAVEAGSVREASQGDALLDRSDSDVDADGCAREVPRSPHHDKF